MAESVAPPSAPPRPQIENWSKAATNSVAYRLWSRRREIGARASEIARTGQKEGCAYRVEGKHVQQACNEPPQELPAKAFVVPAEEIFTVEAAKEIRNYIDHLCSLCMQRAAKIAQTKQPDVDVYSVDSKHAEQACNELLSSAVQ